MVEDYHNIVSFHNFCYCYCYYSCYCSFGIDYQDYYTNLSCQYIIGGFGFHFDYYKMLIEDCCYMVEGLKTFDSEG